MDAARDEVDEADRKAGLSPSQGQL
jgi:hypothetical protein